MKTYKYAYLLKENCSGEIDAIIQCNIEENVLQKAIYTACRNYHDLELDESLPSGINCEYEYIREYLQARFDCNFIEFWTKNNIVYY